MEHPVKIDLTSAEMVSTSLVYKPLFYGEASIAVMLF